MFVVAGEDVNYESVVPFAGMRALSLERDPSGLLVLLTDLGMVLLARVEPLFSFWKAKMKSSVEVLILTQS